jgi:polyhydroxybutyrate depolymerase
MRSLLAFSLCLAACGGTLIQARPYKLRTPTPLDESKPMPLVLLLHGYSADGERQDGIMHIGDLVDKERFLLAMPDGTPDSAGNRFWAATDMCCNFGALGVDDVAYLNAVIDDVSRRHNVDAKRIFVIGHSNGGFMAHRLACDLAPRIAAIVSVAGAQWMDVARCKPSGKVSVVQVSGDADPIIQYGGGKMDQGALDGLGKMADLKVPRLVGGPKEYPSAQQTVADWAKLDGCTGEPAEADTIDINPDLEGPETKVLRWKGCAGADVELWTVHGGKHLPGYGPDFNAAVWRFFLAHPKI